MSLPSSDTNWWFNYGSYIATPIVDATTTVGVGLGGGVVAGSKNVGRRQKAVI